MNTFKMDFATDMMKTWTDSVGKAVQSATRFWDDAARTATESGNQRAGEFQGQIDRLGEEFTPLSRKNTEQAQRFIDQQAQRGTKFFHETFDGKLPQTPAEMGERTSAIARQSCEFVRESFDAAFKLNTELLGNWSEYVKVRSGACMSEPQPKRSASK